MTTMDVSVAEPEPGVLVVGLAGELDISNAGRIEQELRRVEGREPSIVVLDLRDLQFIDSTGLRLVVAADARARQHGWRLRVVRGPETVHRVFRITFVDKRLDFVTDPDELEPTP